MVEYIGFISEGEATNELLYCRDFTNAAWVKTNITAALDAEGLTGVANSASTLTATASNGTAFQSLTLSSAEFTTSFYVKRQTGTGTISISDDNGSTYTDITALINSTSFTRVQITNTQANPTVGFKIDTSGDEIIVDFGQVEEKPFATSPILTTATNATRSQDNAISDIAEQPWFNPAEGTLLINFKRTANIETASIAMQSDDGSNNNAIQIGQDTDGNDRQFYGRVVVGGVEQNKLTVVESGFNNRGKCALAYMDGDLAFCVNGGDVVTSSTGDLPTGITNIRIGKSFDESLYGSILSARYYNNRLSDSELQSLTLNEQTEIIIQDGVIVSDDANYSRASTATYYGSDGLIDYAIVDEQRVHYMQDGSGDFGLLLEGERENLLTYSSIASTGWTLTGSATRAAGVFDSPDGTANATELTVPAGLLQGIISTPTVSLSVEPVTYSFYLKHVSGTSTQMVVGSSTSAVWGAVDNFLILIDLSDGSVDDIGASIDEYNVEALPNDWYRLEITGTPDSAGSANCICNNGDGVNAGVFGVFGLQIEVGSFATSYIPTSGSTVTRSKDVANINNISIKDWFNSLKGTFYCDFKRYVNVQQITYAWQVDDTTANNRLYGGQTAAAFSRSTVAGITDGGVDEFLESIPTGDLNRRNKIAFAYEEDNSKFASNGLLSTTDTNCAIPNKLIDFKIGDTDTADSELYGVMRNLSYANRRLTDFELFFITL